VVPANDGLRGAALLLQQVREEFEQGVIVYVVARVRKMKD
jgi:hypothetical protein